ncbi:FliG C-terminal domain-containing protein [Planctomycetaceae bacterium SH139]
MAGIVQCLLGKRFFAMVVAPRSQEATLRRAAILVSNLDAASRRQLLAHLPPREANRVRAAAASLVDVDPLEVRRVMTAFVGRFTDATQHRQESVTESGPGSQQAVSPQGGKQAQGSPPAGHPQLGGANGTAEPLAARPQLQFLSHVSDSTLVQLVQAEHPQTVAVVLGALPAEQAARLLKHMPPDLRLRALQRLGRLETIPTELFEEIAQHLRDSIGAIEPVAAAAGRQSLASIFAALDSSERSDLAVGLGSSDWIIASALQQAANQTTANQQAVSPQVTGQAGDASQHSRQAVFAEAGFVGQLAAGQSAEAADERVNKAANQGAEEVAELTAEEVDHILHSLSPQQLQQVLAELDSRQALLAVCGLEGRAAQRLIKRLPRRQAKLVRNQLKQLSGMEVVEVEAAKAAAAWRALEVYEPDSAVRLRTMQGPAGLQADQQEVFSASMARAA